WYAPLLPRLDLPNRCSVRGPGHTDALASRLACARPCGSRLARLRLRGPQDEEAGRLLYLPAAAALDESDPARTLGGGADAHGTRPSTPPGRRTVNHPDMARHGQLAAPGALPCDGRRAARAGA